VAERPEEEDEGFGACSSVRERDRDGMGQAGQEAKAQEEWGSGLAEGQGPDRWAENLSWAQFKK
jgi:hypothetical protein